MGIGDALKEIRTGQGMSQSTLAKESGFTQVSISRIETGNQDPSFTTLERLAKAMGVPVSTLVRKAESGEGRKRKP